MITLEIYKELEDKEVFIHYIPEHYTDGTNLNFSIEFKGKDTQTAWYNDNHEFGDVFETMVASIKLAQWYLDNPRRIELINSGYHEEEYRDYVQEHREYLKTIMKG